ncbi:TonB-dependent receptor [Schleiferiaceae bacterium]|nr:TonB-dependent receptor [Schleiferiaceae bacterium]
MSFGWLLPAAAQTCLSTISGVVIDAHDETPMEEVSVYLQELGQEVWTDKNGQFQFDKICFGDYHVVLRHVGCPTRRLLLRLKKDTALTVSLEHHQNMLHEVDVHDHHDDALDDRSLGNLVIEANSHKSLAAALEQMSGVGTISNGADIGSPILQGLFGNRTTIVNNGVVHKGQQWGTDHSPEIDINAAATVSVVSGSGIIRYPGSHMGGVVLLQPSPIPFDPHLHGKVASTVEENGRGGTVNAQIYRGMKRYQWRIGGTLKRMGDRSAPNYFLNNTGTQQNHLNAEFNKQFTRVEWNIFYNYYGAEFGILRGSHIGNLSDLQAAFNRSEPFYTDTTFSYSIDAPRQEVKHHQLKSALAFKLQTGKLEINTALQRNQRREFDIRRSGRSVKPALSLLQYNLQNEAVWSIENNIEMGYQFSGKNNWNLPETGILPLLPNYTSFTNGVFMSYQIQERKFKMETGARYDYVARNVVRLTSTQPREIERFTDRYHSIALLARGTVPLDKRWQLLGEIAFKQRPPEINELYSFGLHQGVSGIEEGTIDLNQEQGLKGSLHLRGLMGDRFHLDLNGFGHLFSGYIYLQPSQEYRLTIRGAFPVFTYEQCDAFLYGSDAKFRYTLSNRWKLESNWSYVFARNRSENLPLNFIPPLSGVNELHYEIAEWKEWRNLAVSLNHRFSATQWNWDPSLDLAPPPDGYHLWNLSLSGTFKGWKNEPKIRVGIENMMNTTYRDYLNRQRYFADALGRNITLGWLQYF